jgi:hypothetical protein
MPDSAMAIMTVLGAFAPLFSKRVLASVKLWLAWAMLALGQHTVTAVFRVRGKSTDAH